jgi:hypothetical protein
MADGVEVIGDASCSALSRSGDSADASFNYTLSGGLTVDARAAATPGFGTVLTTAVLNANLILTTAGPVRPGVAHIQLFQDFSIGGGAISEGSTSIGPYRFTGQVDGFNESVPFTLGEPFDVVVHQFDTAQNNPLTMGGSAAAGMQFLDLQLFEAGPPPEFPVRIELATPEPNTGWQLAAGLACALILARARSWRWPISKKRIA